MRRILSTAPPVCLCLAGFLLPVPLRADWVTLRDGRHLRGLDLVKVRLSSGDGYRFTLESGEVTRFAANDLFFHEKSPKDEMVQFRGKSVSLREKVDTLRAERRKELERRMRVVEAAAREEEASSSPDPPRPAASQLDSWSPEQLTEALVATVTSGTAPSARRYAARRLGDIGPPEDGIRNDARSGAQPYVAGALARASLRDPYRSVRDISLAGLKKMRDATVEDMFIAALRNPDPQVRTRAANALAVLPVQRAIPELIATLHLAWTGFGRASISQVTQRAYIADYELVSGGTGFSIVEVADPVVRTSVTGVAMDAKVRRVELTARLRALRKATGQDFGVDVTRWRKWWAENGGAK